MILSDLPELVLLKIVSLCSQSIEDVFSLRQTCSKICSFIDQNWHRVYHINLSLGNGDDCVDLATSKPVLNLKLEICEVNYNIKDYDVTFVDSMAACEKEDYYIYEDENGRRVPLIIKPKKFSNISKLENLLTELNLNNLQTLDISFQGVSCFRYPYHVLLQNNDLKTESLKKCKLGVNFLCGYCTEFVANIQQNFPNLQILEILNIPQSETRSSDIMICLSLRIFEKFDRDSPIRKTVVRRLPVYLLGDLEDLTNQADQKMFSYEVIPETAQFATLQFG